MYPDINSETTHGNLQLERVLRNLALGTQSELLTGHVYYVIKSAESYAADFVKKHQTKYYDGTYRVYEDDGTGAGIQSALDATQANRDDYVIVLPSNSDYDLTVTLTMSKNRVHLIAPAGLGTKGLPTNACRLHQNTAATAIITVTGDCVEIAGFFFKGYSNADVIILSGTRWHSHIHDNFFGISSTAAGTNAGIEAAGACSHFSFHDNYFTNYSPGAVTGTNNAMTGFINVSSASSTRGLIRNNIMHTGVNTTVATGINAAGYGMFIDNNLMFEDLAFGGSDAGTLTLGISTSTDALVTNNRIGIVTAGNAVSGGTADSSYVETYEASSGGTLAT